MSHADIQAMLVCPDELRTEERVLLACHLAACEACRRVAALYADNRRLLRPLAQVCPPEELRLRVLDVAQDSGGGLRLYLPIALAFSIPIASLVTVALIFVGGLPALVGLVAVLLVLGSLASPVAAERLSGAKPPMSAERVEALKRLMKEVAADVVGIVAGTAAFAVLVILLALLAAHLR